MKLPSYLARAVQPKSDPKSGAVPQSDPFQKLAFAVLWLYVFLLLSRFSEFVDRTNVLHLVFTIGIAAAIAALVTGGVYRAISSRVGIWLCAFTAWLTFELPFSSWRGGSFHGLVDTWLKSFATFVLVAGLLFTVSQVRTIALSCSLATLFIVAVTLHSGVEAVADNRLSFETGTLGNANDLAAQLVLGLPFLIYFLLSKKQNILYRVIALISIPPLLYVVLKTGSRGALLAIGLLSIVYFWKMPGIQKSFFAVMLIVGIAAAPFLLPENVKERYKTMISRAPAETLSASAASALESEEARRTLLIHSFQLTAAHPIFGVGLGQFADASSLLSISEGKAAMWHPAHSFLLLILAETGIPGLLLYSAALWVCFSSLIKLRKASKNNPALAHIYDLSFCLLMVLFGFSVCSMFTTNAYTFHFPMIAGLIAAFTRSAKAEVAALVPAPQVVKTPWLPAPRKPTTLMPGRPLPSA